MYAKLEFTAQSLDVWSRTEATEGVLEAHLELTLATINVCLHRLLCTSENPIQQGWEIDLNVRQVAVDCLRQRDQGPRLVITEIADSDRYDQLSEECASVVRDHGDGDLCPCIESRWEGIPHDRRDLEARVNNGDQEIIITSAKWWPRDGYRGMLADGLDSLRHDRRADCRVLNVGVVLANRSVICVPDYGPISERSSALNGQLSFPNLLLEALFVSAR